MKKNKNSKSIVDQKDDKDKANTVFLKLLAKNKRKANPWGVVRSETLIPEEKSDIRNEEIS